MSYLSRDESPVDAKFWEQIDAAVVSAARNILTGRRFLHLFGPLGIGATNIQVDEEGAVSEFEKDGLFITKGRKYVEIPQIYEDFTLFAKDMEASARQGFPADLSKAMIAAEAIAQKEDKLIFFGSKANGYDGLLTCPGVSKIKKSNWAEGENAFSDIAAGLGILSEKGIYGSYTLILSPDLFLKMQRLQPGTGMLEIDRVKSLFGGRVLNAPVLGKEKAVLLSAEARNMDLVVGQDMAAAYLEQKDLNHVFRVLETILLRIKRKDAIVVFE